jgi:hypothetical protein
MAPATAGTLSLSGWNADLVVEASAPGPTYLAEADPIDIPNNWSYPEVGLAGITYGLPAGGMLTSSSSGTIYDIGDYTRDQALLLSTNNPFGVLTLDTPAQFSSLSVLAVSTNGGGPGLMFINYTDSTMTVTDFGAPDWFFQSPGVTPAGNAFDYAAEGIGRVRRSDGALDAGGGVNPDLFETLVLAVDPTRTVASIGFTRTYFGGTNTATAIFAVNGTVIPEPSTVALGLIAVAGLVGLRRFGR